MKCPYAVHRKTVTQTDVEYDDDGNQNGLMENMSINKSWMTKPVSLS